MNDHERVREARRWLQFSREDLDVAKELLRQGRIRHVCYCAQQSAEKALKAALVLDGLDVPHLHDLNAVRNRLPDSWTLKREYPDLAELTVWAAESRYPDDWQEATQADADRAVSQARGVCNSIVVEFDRRINAS